MDATVLTPVLTVSEQAIATILELQAAEGSEEPIALWVEVTGAKGTDYTYDLAFEPFSSAAEGDAVYQQGELTVIIPKSSIDSLSGATLDLPTTDGQSGLVLRNPNKADPLAGLQLDLSGDLPAKVNQLLEHMINPALASHGGFAELKGVKEDKVFITMGGGCQGCSVSAMTLRDGISRTIREHLPEVTEVIDVTDHDAGENPYYA